MAGIIFPDVAGSVLPALQIQKSQQLMDLEAARQRKLDADEARQQSAGQYVQGAMQGDPEATANLFRTNPTLGTHVQSLISQNDSRNLAQIQMRAKRVASSAGNVLSADPADQEAAYQLHLQDMREMAPAEAGHMPSTYAGGGRLYVNKHFNSGVSADKLMDSVLKQPQVLGGGGSTPGGAPGGGYQATLQGHESPNGATNPTSGAGGYYQFMPETWAATRSANPDLNLPQFVQQATKEQQSAAEERFRAANAAELQKGGIQPTPANLYLAHRAGTQGAQTILNAAAKDPNAPMESIVPPIWVQQNPDMRTTVGQFVNMAQNRFPQTEQSSPQLAGNVPPGTPMPQGGDQPTGNQPGVMPGPPAPPPIQTLHDYVRSAAPGAQLIGDRMTGQPLYDHNGYVGVQLPNGQRTFIPPPPKTQQPPAGYRPSTDGNLEAIPGGPADLTRKLGINVPPELNNAHGDQFRQSDFWQQQPMALKNNVEGVLDGSIPLSALPKRPGVGADLSMVIGLAKQIDPAWSPTQGAGRQKFEVSLADGNSKNGQAVQAINIAPLHAQDLLKITDAINQQNPQAVQGIINKLKEQFGDTNVPDMTAARNLVALEFLRAAVGPGALNQTLEKAFIDSISTANTSDQVRKVVSGYTDKLMARAHEMIDTGKEYNKDFPETKIIHPRTQEALDYLKGPKRDGQGAPVAPTPSLWDRVFGGATSPAPGAPVNSQDALRKKYGLE